MLFRLLLPLISVFALGLAPELAFASGGGGDSIIPHDFTASNYGFIALGVFFVAYLFVIGEEGVHMRKSKPVIVAAGIIWVIVAMAYGSVERNDDVHYFLNHNLLEYVNLMLFLLAAMTYINTLEERQVFAALRGLLVSRGYGFRKIFWITGVLAFVISPLADNLTTALLMAAVAMAVAGGKTAVLEDPVKRTFVVIACINIVVAANAGGAFSPFGDITTLMVWQKGIVEFHEFFVLFVPSVVNWIIPAVIMSFFVPQTKPEPLKTEIKIKRGGIVVIFLFILTIALAVSFHNMFHLPPMMGMMTGLGILKLFGYYLKMTNESAMDDNMEHSVGRWDIFTQMQRAEWDTLMFFYGVILCVGGLGALGYLDMTSNFMYDEMGPTKANILVGVLSAIVDNIPVMFAVLSMMPEMSHEQWLLVTLTAGVGGSMLSVGSAAGVALMGQARGVYTFMAHLKWAWAIALGYAASIYVHIVMSGI